MSKALDYISLTIVIFLLMLVLSTFIFTKWAVVFLFASATTLVILFTVYYISGKHTRPYSYDRLAMEFSVRGASYLINLVKSTIKNNDFESGSNYIIIEDSILVACFKFSNLAITDLNSIVQLAEEKKKKRIFIMARGVERKAFQVLQFYDAKITIVKIRSIYNHLKKYNALPNLKPRKKQFSLQALFEAVFQRANMKNYLISGVILISAAFITPLRTYYLAFGSVSLIMALLTLTPLGKGTFKTDKVFDKFASPSDQISIDELMPDAPDKNDNDKTKNFISNYHDDSDDKK